MRSWWWKAGGLDGDCLVLFVELEHRKSLPLDIRPLVRDASLPGMVIASPEVVASLISRVEGADHYYDSGAYSRLPFFTGKNYYGPSQNMVVTSTALTYDVYGGLPVYDPEKYPPGALCQLIEEIVRNPEWRVKYWKVTLCNQEDGMGNPPLYIAEGDHQALVEYLDLENLVSPPMDVGPFSDANKPIAEPTNELSDVRTEIAH